MRRYLIICAALLAACGPDLPPIVDAPPRIPADLLRGCSGWTGPMPQTEGDLIDAVLAERGGRLCANGKIKAIREIAEMSHS